MSFYTSAIRVLLVVLGGALLGWQFGSPLLGALFATLAVIGFWNWQLSRLQEWLADESRKPPDLDGVWGVLVARIYKARRDSTVAREELQSTVDYLLDSFAAMRDGVVLLDQGIGLRWCNESAQAMLGLRYPEDVGQAVSNIVRVPEFVRYMAMADFREPLEFETAKRPPRHLQMTVSRFSEGDILLFVQDVTERNRTEQMRRDFVGNVSHELRTPLTVITGYLDTLKDADNLSDAQKRAFQRMAEQSARMETLIRDLLWLSRIESSELERRSERVEIPALLRELREELSRAYPGRKLELELQSSEAVWGDYREIYSAVSNLVLNALNYSRPEKAVTVSWRRDGERLRLAVTDEGIGIDDAHLPRLTERFYRVDDSRSQSSGGTGLGLAIVKHVAAAHGARLDIDSELGKGSTFCLVFPVSEEAQEPSKHVETG